MEIPLTKDKFLDIVKKSKKKGTCQFPDCQNISIQAHSISKSLLKVISENGKVVVLKNNMFNVRSPGGSVHAQLDGINTATTFPGFCSCHDNSLFESIDNNCFDYTRKQAFLYAYRLIAKEIIRRQQSLDWFPNIKMTNPSIQSELNGLTQGLFLGFRSLKEHKKIFDNILTNDKYDNIGYSLFEVENEPFFLFSGISYPDFDFQGNLIQDLSNTKVLFQMLAFTSVRLNSGWGVLFIWEKESDYASIKFFNSLRDHIKKNKALGLSLWNALFRFIISRSECYVFKKSAWDKISEEKKKEVITRANNVIKYPFVDFKTDLVEGLDNVFEIDIDRCREVLPVYIEEH